MQPVHELKPIEAAELGFRYAALFFSSLTFILALSAIIGLINHIESFIRYVPKSKIIVMNTAICFVLLASGVAASCYRRDIIARFIGIIVAIFAMLSLSQQLFNIDLGIDLLFFSDYDTTEMLYPGRMAPNTCVCFIISGICLAMLACNTYPKFCVTATCILELITLSMAAVFVVGYFSDSLATYIWGNKIAMAAVTAVGFIILSLAMLCLTAERSLIFSISIRRSIPFAVWIAIIVATILLVQKIGYNEAISGIATDIDEIIFIAGVIIAFAFAGLLHMVNVSLTSIKSEQKALSLIQATLDATQDGIVATTLDGDILTYNQVFLDLWHLSREKIQSMNRRDLTQYISQKVVNKEKFFLLIKRLTLDPDERMTQELKLKDGSIFEVTIRPQYVSKDLVGRVFSYRDITTQKRLEVQLLRQSTYDSLTDLPNRALLLELAQRSFNEARENNSFVAILVIDIVKFSQINDLFGRSKGDMLLSEIASRLKNVTPKDAVLGRSGGDEFLLLRSMQKSEEAVQLIQNINKAFEKSFEVFDNQVIIKDYIGVAFFPKDGRDVDTLLSNADIALLRAKQDPHNHFQFYTQDMNAYTVNQLQLETELHAAVEQNQFVVYYQPEFNLETGKAIGVEALVCWNHPKRGLVPPGEFIGLAEEIGLINQIGNIVLREGCQQVKSWLDAGLDVKLAVNVSALQLKNVNFDKNVAVVLQETGLSTKHLEIELTETVLFDAMQESTSVLDKLIALGISISIDDFGTGYSSFAYIKNFIVNKIKIDQSFVKESNKEEERALISAIIAMGKSLHVTIIAEGIETKEQLDFLTKMGCDQGQGFYLARPMPADACKKFLQDHI